MKVSKTNESGNVALIAIAVVAGLVIGFAGGHVTKKKDTASSSSTTSTASAQPNTATKAADLRANLVLAGVEHMTLTDQAVDAALDGSPDAAATGAALYANGNDIGATVDSVYPGAGKTFDAVWKLHLDEFVKYAVASKSGDAAGKTAALDAISTGYTKPLSQFLAKANPKLPEATLEDVLSKHVAMTAVMIDDHTAGKYADEAAQLKAANEHIATIFSTLAGGIVAQYPDKFQD